VQVDFVAGDDGKGDFMDEQLREHLSQILDRAMKPKKLQRLERTGEINMEADIAGAVITDCFLRSVALVRKAKDPIALREVIDRLGGLADHDFTGVDSDEDGKVNEKARALRFAFLKFVAERWLKLDHRRIGAAP
jgi:hypothetical protein